MVIPVFIPHQGCRHCCVFCNQKVITAASEARLPSAFDLDRIISTHLATAPPGRPVELAFFGGNFLGLPKPEIIRLLTAVQPFLEKGLIRSVRCSTRPDTITPDILAATMPLGLDLVELGVQSMDDTVLAGSLRGHTRDHTLAAMACLKDVGMKTGVQLMVGLPGDSREKALDTARTMASLKPDLARIYPVLVLSGSLLAQWYQEGKYRPLGLDQAISQVKAMVGILEGDGIPVVRIGLQATDLLEDPAFRIAGPWHPAFGHLVRSALVLDQVEKNLEAFLTGPQMPRQVSLRVSPRYESRLRGDKNGNLEALGRRYPGICFRVDPDPSLSQDQVEIKVLP